MNNILIWTLIIGVGAGFGIAHHKAGYNSELSTRNQYYKFLEFWRVFANYLIAGVLVYYFAAVRWPQVQATADIKGSDFVLGALFLICIFGWLPYFIKNVTEGINVIFEKVLRK
jgi:hypothetical protein